MAHSYVSNLMHCVFSTKERLKIIDSDLQSRLWPYIGGIERENRIKSLAIGGTSDHLHCLLSLPAMMSFAKAIQLIKGGSSKWVHESFPQYRKFGWQEGYAAFSLSPSQLDGTISYIVNQHEHHRRKTFEEEVVQLLEKHAISYDKRYLFR